MHYSVLLNECMEYLAIRPDGIYIDATCGLGGHTKAIAGSLRTGFVLSSDRDADSLEMAMANTAEFADRIKFAHSSFSRLPKAAAEAGIPTADGLLADLGVSRYQLTDAERGFSLMTDGPVD
ncbi:MAG: 16S rRNA (cytosine(1402)-N(4))-methyltransferase, partial [Bryobacteraceae bacterium]